MRALVPTAVAGLILAGLLAACSADAGDGSAGGGRQAKVDASLPRVGDPLPAIAALTLDGRKVDTASLHGRTVLLNLWFHH